MVNISLIHERVLRDMDDGVVGVDFEGTVVAFNDAAARILGVPDKPLGETFAEAFLLREGLDEFTQTVLDAVSTRQSTGRQLIKTEAGGKRRALSISTSTLLQETADGEVPSGIIAVFTDITETEALRESERELAAKVASQYGELQTAYRDAETNNDMLAAALRRVRVIQGAAGAGVVGLFLAVGLFAWYGDSAANAVPAQAQSDEMETIRLAPRQLNTAVLVSGRFAPTAETSILSPIDGIVTTVSFRYGDMVDAGQELIRVDTVAANREYRRLRTELFDAAARVQELENWGNSPDMVSAQRMVEKTRRMLDKQKRRMEETAFLLDRGVIPAAEHDAAVEQYETLDLDHEDSKRRLDLVAKRGAAQALEVARLDFENLSDQVQDMETALANAVVRAPVAGVVMNVGTRESRNGNVAAEGKAVERGQLLATIADISSLRVSGTVDESEIMDIKVGQPATVTTEAHTDLELAGTVTNVSAEAIAGSSSGPAMFDVAVRVDEFLPEARRSLRLGMSADLRIVTRRTPDALLVPLAAVREAPAGPTVFVVDPQTGEHRETPFEAGFTTLDEVEVVAGLAAGDVVVYPVAGYAP